MKKIDTKKISLGIVILLIITGVVFAGKDLFKSVTNSPSNKVTANTQSTKKEASQSTTISESQGDKTQVQGIATHQRTQKTSSSQNSSTQNTTPPAPIPVVHQTTLNIKIGDSNYSYKVVWTDGMSVFDQLNNAHNQFVFSLKYNNYGPCPGPDHPPITCGAFVTEIHGYSCQCWTYERADVNGNKLSANAASWQKINEDDIITWKTT